ncbi:MAG: hypothetical protein AB8I08_16925 [Sandaracinaceae bacterium]
MGRAHAQVSEPVLHRPGELTESLRPTRVLVVDRPTGLARALRMELTPAGVTVVELEGGHATALDAARLRTLGAEEGADAVVWVEGNEPAPRLRVAWWTHGSSEAAVPHETPLRTLALLATSLLEEARAPDPLPARPRGRMAVALSRPTAANRAATPEDADESQVEPPAPGEGRAYLSVSTGFGGSIARGANPGFLGSVTRLAGGVDFAPGLRVGLSSVFAVGEAVYDRPPSPPRSDLSSVAMGGLELGFAHVWGPVFFDSGVDVHIGYLDTHGVGGDAVTHGGDFGFGGGGFVGIGVVVASGTVLFARADIEAFLGRGERSILSGTLGLEWR